MPDGVEIRDPARDVPRCERGKGRGRGKHSECAASREVERFFAKCWLRPKCSRHDFGVVADVWSVTSFNELARDGQDVDRWNHPASRGRRIEAQLRRATTLPRAKGPVIAATDYMRSLFAEQIRAYVPRRNIERLGPTVGVAATGAKSCVSSSRSTENNVCIAALSALTRRCG